MRWVKENEQITDDNVILLCGKQQMVTVQCCEMVLCVCRGLNCI